MIFQPPTYTGDMTDNDGLTKIASGLKVNNTKLINLTTIVAYLCADIRCCMLVDSMLSLMRLSWAYKRRRLYVAGVDTRSGVTRSSDKSCFLENKRTKVSQY